MSLMFLIRYIYTCAIKTIDKGSFCYSAVY